MRSRAGSGSGGSGSGGSGGGGGVQKQKQLLHLKGVLILDRSCDNVSVERVAELVRLLRSEDTREQLRSLRTLAALNTSVDILRSTQAGKEVKRLRKSEDESIRLAATKLVIKWTSIVQGGGKAQASLTGRIEFEQKERQRKEFRRRVLDCTDDDF